MATLKEVFTAASDRERERLAQAAGVSVEYLGQVARGWARQRTAGAPKKRVRLSISSLRKLSAADRRLKLAALVEEMDTEAETA